MAIRQIVAIAMLCRVIQWPTPHHGLSSIGRHESLVSSSEPVPRRSFGGKSSRHAGINVIKMMKLTTTPIAEKMPNILIGTRTLTASVASPTAVVPVANESGSRA